MEPRTKFCTKCCSTRATVDFRVSKKGKVNVTCSRHGKKRPLASMDLWSDFFYELRSWNHPP